MKKIDVFGYLVLLTCIGVLFYKNQQLSSVAVLENKPEQVSEGNLIGKAFPCFSLTGLDDDVMLNFPEMDGSGSFYLFVVFSPTDCGRCFDEAPFWQVLPKAFNGKVKVIGIISADMEGMALSFAEGKDIQPK